MQYRPYQLYPEASKEGEDKYDWYKKSRYANSEEKMEMYKTLMTAYGLSAGINYKVSSQAKLSQSKHCSVSDAAARIPLRQTTPSTLVRCVLTDFS